MGWLGLIEGKEKKEITDTELPAEVEAPSNRPHDDVQSESSRTEENSKSSKKAKKKQREGMTIILFSILTVA
jgi:hypothetical protein